MKFEIVHKFDAPVEEVERVLFSEKLFPLLKERMTTILDVKPVSVERVGNKLRRKVQYNPKPIINSIMGKKVEPEWMVFTESSEYDFAKHQGTFENIPTHYKVAGVLSNKGELILRSTGGSTCEQVIKGDLVVSVFVVGKVAERIIASNAEKILDEEAQVVRQVIAKKEF